MHHEFTWLFGDVLVYLVCEVDGYQRRARTPAKARKKNILINFRAFSKVIYNPKRVCAAAVYIHKCRAIVFLFLCAWFECWR